MKFKIENGSDQIGIGLCEVGTYFKFNSPLSVTWNYSGGTVGLYFCLLPYSKAYREELLNKLTVSLNKDFFDDVGSLHELLSPLFSLFKNGDYTLDFYKDDTFFQFKSSYDNFGDIQYSPLEIMFGEEVDLNKIEKIKHDYNVFIKQNEASGNRISSDIFVFATDWVYDGSSEFYATEPRRIIDQERVDYFENQIAAGERPFAIVMNAVYPKSHHHSPYYVLDGHHKLLAYQKLRVYPPLAVISYLPVDDSEMEFDAEKLATSLYPWQIQDILKNWDKKDNYIAKKLKDPTSPLHQFIKNGHIKEYYENNQLKHEAFYINDKIDGKSLGWYDNGQLNYEQYYNKGKRTGIWKSYHSSGSIQFIQPFNIEGIYDGDVISYYENGQKRRQQTFENGHNVDGYTQKSWFENGDKEAELEYLDGKIIVMKNWNSWGHLINHEVYDPEVKKLVKVAVPPPDLEAMARTVLANVNAAQKKMKPVIDNSPPRNEKSMWYYVRIILLIYLAIRLLIAAINN